MICKNGNCKKAPEVMVLIELAQNISVSALVAPLLTWFNFNFIMDKWLHPL